jgi:hypothetical protein
MDHNWRKYPVLSLLIGGRDFLSENVDHSQCIVTLKIEVEGVPYFKPTFTLVTPHKSMSRSH